jgi:hydrogenase/urease accessory protein HupE
MENMAADALLRYQSARGVTQAARLTPSNPQAVIAQRPDRWQVARTYFITGVEHILMGYDHLLFVLCLVLLLNGAWRVAGTVTAFTIAHSLTLVATTLELISVPGPPVEAAIALSIVFLAVEVVKRDPHALRLSERIPWVVAFLFGLLHGFGFAGALAEIGLPQGEVPMALLTFNLGVEAGQILIVCGAMLVLSLLRRINALYAARFQRLSAYAIGTIAVMWLLQRVLGVS